MMGSFLTRVLVMALGYVYPAYECYKTVEKNKPEIEQLRFWCQYWILVAVLTIFERVGDAFVSWVPMYSEAKLAFFIYLWYPKTRGTTYVYDSFFRPYVAKHETEIDRSLLELRARAGDILVLYGQKAASYGQTRFFEILQYVAAQSETPRPRPVQQRQQQQQQQQQPAHLPATATAPTQPPPFTTALQHQPSNAPTHPPSAVNNQAPDLSKKEEGNPVAVAPPGRPLALPNSTQLRSAGEARAIQAEAGKASATEDLNTPPQETAMEETMRVTRSRLRARTAAAGAAATASVGAAS
ncbi:unnamed protein product [Spirodela intermedia]|uniref:HVA22-like protein n=1 Tax=Spirodela intermedia TaxID=51605 RepID=A0A7I8L2H8_SPIIN|nr:unnamed protein product [Spirodela intermedia]